MDLNRSLPAWSVAAIALSAVAWWLGTGLHPVWWIGWLATMPVLLAASRVKRLNAFAIAFAACVIGGLNMWTYLNKLGLPLGISFAVRSSGDNYELRNGGVP
jgi:apolipoprotein N-acyltransferase